MSCVFNSVSVAMLVVSLTELAAVCTDDERNIGTCVELTAGYPCDCKDYAI